jgi:hypothetical protein
MPSETCDKALEAELRTEALLEEVDVRAAAAYEAGVWRELCRGGGQGATGGGPSRRAWKRRAGADMDGGGAHSMHLQKRRKACLELEATCRCRLLRLRNRMVSG